MNYKQAGLAVVCVGGGALAATLIIREGWFSTQKSDTPTLKLSEPNLAPHGELQTWSTPRSSELAVLPPSANTAANIKPEPPTDALSRFAVQPETDRVFGWPAKKERLLAAGFSESRIEWIRSRSEEMVAKRMQELATAAQQGMSFDVNKFAAYMFDPELDLMDEMAYGEFERYRSALGRPRGINVDGILAGSNAEASGLKPGDEIIAYDGERTFNLGQLRGLVNSSMATAGSVLLDVERNGQVTQVLAQRGELGFESSARP